jgi:hypothetical protein
LLAAPRKKTKKSPKDIHFEEMGRLSEMCLNVMQEGSEKLGSHEHASSQKNVIFWLPSEKEFDFERPWLKNYVYECHDQIWQFCKYKKTGWTVDPGFE